MSCAAPCLLNDFKSTTEHDSFSNFSIVFVHGLTGNRETTWTRNAGKRTACFWPQDLLPDEEHGVSNARIATWGYDADVVNNRPLAVVSKNTIEQHAESLCTDLANYRTRNAAVGSNAYSHPKATTCENSTSSFPRRHVLLR